MPRHKVRSTDTPRRRATHGTMTSELTLSSLAWLIASVTMRDIPFAVSEQPSVAKGKMKEYYIRTLRMVSDEADVVLLVLPARDTTGAARGKLVETSDSCSCST
ncbi:hypothetical protein EDB85DRAFT_1975307 [Lactarius pseudohatsudake]|nr:hypothetical protein EDB85DRAFT_1975307 [Lactarius pseudohatsudake]